MALDYSEIRSVPPLPLWTLLAADKEKGLVKEKSDEYNELFDNQGEEESLTLEINLEDESVNRSERRLSLAAEKQGLSYFGPRQVGNSSGFPRCQNISLTKLRC